MYHFLGFLNKNFYFFKNFSKIQKQEELIKQLQEQHFEQYMNQVYQQQLVHQQQQAEQLRAMKVIFFVDEQKKTKPSLF